MKGADHSHQEYQGTCSIARFSIMINKSGVIDWSVSLFEDRARHPREVGWFSEDSWE